jgi:hypothetical protein
LLRLIEDIVHIFLIRIVNHLVVLLSLLMIKLAMHGHLPLSIASAPLCLCFELPTCRVPAIANAGNVANNTKVIVQPVMNAKIKPETNVVVTITIVEIFSPIAPWKAKVSTENLEEI